MNKFTKTILLFCLGMSACAQDVGDIDRTQPYRINKSIFDGEWYHQKTSFDIPYTAGFTFTGETSELERVKWQIEESYLIAYRSYELVENTKASNLLPDVTFKGAPIAAYAIESHFDVVREYNSLTGEETNVLYENTVDRAWYERSFIRVDWSKNLVLNFNFMDDQVSQSPISYFVQDRDDEDRLLFGVKSDGKWTNHQDWREIASLDKVDYIDIVDTVFANPQEIEFDDGYGGVIAYPECWFYGSADCQPARIKIRSAFLKADTNNTFEPLEYPDNAIARDADGKALTDSSGSAIRIPWFDKFGYFRVERFSYDRQREITESGRTYLINRWNIWADAPGCKNQQSYANCTVKPIEYYVSPNFPAALIPAARYTVSQWNDSFKEVVNHLKYAGTKSLDQIEDVFILKENSYKKETDRGQRIGDLRYSFIYYVPEPQAVSPLGYGPSAVDPKTGEIIQATAYVYGAPIESWATLGTDIVDLINGTIGTTELIEGEDVREYVTRARNQNSRRQRDLSHHEVRTLARSNQIRRGQAKQKQLGKRKMRLDRGQIRAKLSAIENTPLEERLLNDEIVRSLKPQAGGIGDRLSASLSPRERQQISPARWGTRGAARAHTERKRLKQRKNNLYLARNLDDAVVGLAERLKGTGDRETIRNAIVERMFASTAEHEVGHTLGLRHNFGGSYDSVNYHPHYWTLRGNSPAPLERPDANQVQQGIREYQYASIMDYSARFSSDIHGIGLYDRAAIRFGYGQLVDVFEAPPNEPLSELVGLPYALHEIRHYTSYPRLFGGDAANMYRRKVVPYSQLVAQMRKEAPATLVEVPFRFCSDEYEGALNWCNTWDDGADAYEIVRNASDAYDDYYIFNSFARDALEIEPWYHTDRVYYRYLIHPQVQYQHWVYDSWDESGYWDLLREDAARYGIEDRPYNEAADGGLIGLAASQLGVNLLASIVQAPEPGAYYADPDDNTYYNYSYDTDIRLCPPGSSDPDCSDLNIALGTGKYAFSLYQGESGYYYYERLHVIGSFYDKLAAIQTLTSPETNFLGVDTDADISQYAISMYLYFPDQVTRLIGGSAVGDYNSFAGYVADQKYYSRDMFSPSPINATQQAVDPATSFTVELYSAWLGMAFLNAGFDNSFNDLMRVFIEGNGEGLTPTDPTRVARFTHSRSGREFVAIRAEDPQVYSPAWSLVTRTQQWAQDPSLAPETKQYYIENSVAIMETLRGLHELYGKLYF
jgi:hypothetical protein